MRVSFFAETLISAELVLRLGARELTQNKVLGPPLRVDVRSSGTIYAHNSQITGLFAKFDRIRQLRHRTEYPEPDEPVATLVDVDEALPVVRQIISLADSYLETFADKSHKD